MSAEERLQPPRAKKVPKELSFEGRKRVDDYAWLRDKKDPEVVKYIEAENRHADAVTAHLAPLQEKLYREFLTRLKENDTSVPVKVDDYYYYERTEEGKQYPLYCRRKGSMSAREEVILDQNALGKGHEFFVIGSHKVSPDHRLLAYTVDLSGEERYELRFKDLTNGQLLPDRITNVHDIEWANDSHTVLYSTIDDVNRADKVFRHVLGTDPKDDSLMYHEKDPRYEYLVVSKTRSRAFITITLESHTTAEMLYLDADSPMGSFRSFCPRKQGIKYFVRHHPDWWYVITDEGAPEFKLMRTPASDTSKAAWTEVIPGRDDVSIEVSDPVPHVEVFRDYIALYERKDGLRRVRVIDIRTNESHYVQFPEPLHDVWPVENPDSGSNTLRLSFSSLVIPEHIYDYDMSARKLVLRKRTEIPGHEPEVYQSERVFAAAPDGVKVPILLLHRKGLAKDGRNPLYLYAYGAYADFESTGASFRPDVFSLVDRGVVFAIAQIRGGGDLGRRWYDQGRVLTKRNSFTDFIACAEHLIAQGYTSSDRLAARGRSAGGLLMGAVVTMRPDLFKTIVAEVPFVDVINTMLDPTVPLTMGEYEEWGGPDDEGIYEYWASYSPYDNIKATRYPDMLVTSAMNDPRVGFWEPAKFVAKLRETKTEGSLLAFKTKITEGHLGASGRYDALKETAFTYAFLLDRLGLDSESPVKQ